MKPLVAIYGKVDVDFFPELKGTSLELSLRPHQEDIVSVEFGGDPAVILCFPPPGVPEKILEMAQVLRMNFPKARLYLLERETFPFDKATLKKNGFDDSFVIPWEKGPLLSSIEEVALYLRNPRLLNFTPVFLTDFDPEEPLTFDVQIYLPMNGVLVPLAREGEKLSGEKLERALSCSQNVVYLEKQDLARFRQYFQAVASRRGCDGAKSETELLTGFEATCRELLSHLFVDNIRDNTFTRSINLMGELKAIVQDQLKARGPVQLEKILRLLMNRPWGPHNHATNVGLYAALFAVCLEFPRPYDLALAGLFHDLGLVTLDEKLFTTAPEDVPADLREQYMTHPNLALETFKRRRLPLNDSIQKAILDHHEMVCRKHQLSLEARILALADHFDYLTRQTEGRGALTPREALGVLLDQNSSDPGNMVLDVGLLRKLTEVLETGRVA